MLSLKRLAVVVVFCVVFSGIFCTRMSAVNATDKKMIINENFRENAKGWILPDGYKIEQHGGRNGTVGLFYERKDSQTYDLALQEVHLKKGARYRFGAWVKTQDVTGKGGGAGVCLEFYGKDGYISGSYPVGINGTNDWQLIKGEVLVPLQTVSARLVLYLRKGCRGKVWFDDVVLEPANTEHNNVYLIYPADGRLSKQMKSVELRVYFESPDKTKAVEGTDCLLFFTIEGKEHPIWAKVENGRVRVNVEQLPVGKGTLLVTITKSQKNLVKTVFNISVTDGTCQVPTNSCIIDQRGRAIVNGKPFLPVGLYMGQMYKKDLDKIANSPFNCLMPYSSMYCRLNPSEKSSVDSIRRTMNYCHQKGIKFIFSIKDLFYEEGKEASPSWQGVTGYDEIVTKVVSEFRNHPALLAWYVNDERPLSMMKQLLNRYQLMTKLDPFHPTWAVFYQFSVLPLYGGSCDVIGVDPYPIYDGTSQSMAKVDFAMDMVDSSALPCWVVPQAFNWAAYREKNNLSAKGNYRFPTEEELRSMSILPALRGAKGFVFYSYFDLQKKMFSKVEKNAFWNVLCRTAKMLRKLEPFLLSGIAPVKPSIEIIKGNVKVRQFRDAEGHTCILIAGIGPGESKAIITVNDVTGLKSRYGKCRSIGKGKYEFSGENICSDILTNQD